MDAQTKAIVRRVYVEPVQLSKPTVVPAEGGALAVASGKAMPAPEGAAERFHEIVDSKVRLAALLEEQARKELVARGYQVAASPGEADAKLRFVVFHGLGVAGAFSNGRGIAMTVNMSLLRSADDKRLLFGIANQVKDPAKLVQVKAAPYTDWFSNDAMVVEQYRLVSAALVSQVLSGL
jgi:hypothetical protein